jgi:hypothetical protein
MSNEIPQIPRKDTPPTTPRTRVTGAILLMAQELVAARFALSRCMDKLDVVQLHDVFDEVSDALDEAAVREARRIITPRNQFRD